MNTNASGIVGTLWMLAKRAIGLKFSVAAGPDPDSLDVVGSDGTTPAVLRCADPTGSSLGQVVTLGFLVNPFRPGVLFACGQGLSWGAANLDAIGVATEGMNWGTAVSAPNTPGTMLTDRPVSGLFGGGNCKMNEIDVQVDAGMASDVDFIVTKNGVATALHVLLIAGATTAGFTLGGAGTGIAFTSGDVVGLIAVTAGAIVGSGAAAANVYAYAV